MIVKGMVDEDFLNYKKQSMFVIFPKCSFKCDKESGKRVCQNSTLAQAPDIEILIEKIVKRYLDNPISKAIVIGGLEPFDSWQDLISLVSEFRKHAEDDIVIYTGYTPTEVHDKIDILKRYKNIIVKFGRYIPNGESRYDEVLGVTLASNNQFAERIS